MLKLCSAMMALGLSLSVSATELVIETWRVEDAKLWQEQILPSFHARYPGRISEVLLDVWMNENGYAYKEVPFVYMEKIDMFKKGMGFLKAKFLHKKYGESF